MSETKGSIPGRYLKLIEKAVQCAKESKLPQRHGAILFSNSGKRTYQIRYNDHGDKVCGFDVPSVHAEANCMKHARSSFMYKDFQGYKQKKMHIREKWNILVVRIDANEKLVNSQPCCMCVNMMQKFGIYRIHYSNDQGGITCQNVSKIESNIDDHITHGLEKMYRRLIKEKKIVRLPLTDLQKIKLGLYKPKRRG